MGKATDIVFPGKYVVNKKVERRGMARYRYKKTWETYQLQCVDLVSIMIQTNYNKYWENISIQVSLQKNAIMAVYAGGPNLGGISWVCLCVSLPPGEPSPYEGDRAKGKLTSPDAFYFIPVVSSFLPLLSFRGQPMLGLLEGLVSYPRNWLSFQLCSNSPLECILTSLLNWSKHMWHFFERRQYSRKVLFIVPDSPHFSHILPDCSLDSVEDWWETNEIENSSAKTSHGGEGGSNAFVFFPMFKTYPLPK